MQRYFLLSTFYPFLPPHRLPEGTCRDRPPCVAARGNTPILHKDSNPRHWDGQRRIEKTDQQKGRVVGGGKKRYEENQRRPPLPHLHPHQHAGGMMGIKRGWKQRDEQRTEKKNEKTGVAAYKTTPPRPHPARDWHLVTVTSSSRRRHTRQTHRWISPGVGFAALCHLCIVSPFISARRNISRGGTWQASAPPLADIWSDDCETFECGPYANNFLQFPSLLISSRGPACQSDARPPTRQSLRPPHLTSWSGLVFGGPTRTYARTEVGVEVPPLQWRSPRPPSPAYAHLAATPKPIKSH